MNNKTVEPIEARNPRNTVPLVKPRPKKALFIIQLLRQYYRLKLISLQKNL